MTAITLPPYLFIKISGLFFRWLTQSNFRIENFDTFFSSLKDENHVVCVDNIKDFTSCFLFSLETQHTIG